MRRQSLTVLIALLCTPAIALAQQSTATGDAPPLHNLTITPAAPPRPALKYTLLPPVIEQTPGNAAVLYQRAMLQLATLSGSAESGGAKAAGQQMGGGGDDFDRIGTLAHDTPLAQLPQSDAPVLLAKYGSVLAQLDEAAACESVRWETPLRSQGVSTPLRHLSPMRDLAKLVALRSRLHVANGQYDEAVRSLQTGLAMARHLNDQAVLIQGLVALGIGAQMLERVEELVQQPGAPNLYWALADLPRPIIDLRSMLESERNILYYTYPHLRDPATLTREQWEQAAANIGQEWTGQGGRSTLASQTLATLSTARLYPEAKRYLIDERGMAPEAVQAIPTFRAVAMYCTDSYDRWMHEATKWWSLPPWQGYEGLCRSEAEVAAVKGAGVGGPFVQVLLPGLRRAYLQFATWDRNIAALQTVEAIRAYAAAHDGKLPAALADITQTLPPPIDPFTGRLFEYQQQDGGATLTAPAPTSDDARFAARYRLTVR